MTHPCKQIVTAAKYLQTSGMTSDQLSQIHHFSLKGRKISFGQTMSYFGTDKNLNQNNLDFAKRIEYVETEHRRIGGNLDTIVQQALRRVPF